MKKTEKSSLKNNAKSNPTFGRTDKLALIKEVHGMLSQFDYVSVKVFKESTERIVAAFLRGRGSPSDQFGKSLGQLIQFSRRSKSIEAKWFSGWVTKIHQLDPERLLIRERSGHLEDMAKSIFKKLMIEIDGFGYVSAADFGAEVYLGSMAGFYHIFSDSDSLRVFGLRLIDAATEIESSRTVFEAKAIPDDYAEMALEDWSDQIVANAWLYPDKRFDDPK